MWPIFASANKFVCIIFSPNSLVCCWLEKVKNGSAPLIVRAYKQYSLDNLELANLVLFNPTIIKQYISSFLQEHNLENAFIAFIMQGPAVVEQFVAMPTSTPHYIDFGITNNARSVLWEYRYVYPNHDGQFVFYVYTVPRSLILQYQLLAIALQCNLITITTQTMALLFAYQNIFGTAFRRSQLAVDMMRHNDNIGDIITMDALRRMVNIGTLDPSNWLYCSAAAGLFSSERIDT